MISVVIPLYNKESTIERTVKSVLAQSVSDWELIVVDDGSRDGGAGLVRQFRDPRIRVVTQANAGVSAARNRGVEHTNSGIVAFVDADDYWDPSHLANLLALVKRFPDASVFATAYFAVYENGHLRKIHLSDETQQLDSMWISDYFADASKGDLPICSSAVAISKLAFSKIGGFPLGIDAGEDIITWARLACAGLVAYSSAATAYYMLPPVSRDRTRATIALPPKDDYVGNELAKLCTLWNASVSSLPLYLGNWHRIRATLFMELNERTACLAELIKAIRVSGVRLRDIASLGLLFLPAAGRAKLLSRWRQRHPVRQE